MLTNRCSSFIKQLSYLCYIQPYHFILQSNIKFYPLIRLIDNHLTQIQALRISVIWSKSFPVFIIPLLIKQNKWVRYKSFSLPPLLPPNHLLSFSKVSDICHRHLLPTFTSRNGRINFITKVVTRWFSEFLLSDTLPTFVSDKSPTFTPTSLRHSAIISSIIYTVFRDKIE